MRRIVAFVCVLAACEDTGANPSAMSEIGSYALIEVDGAPLPWRSVATATDTQGVVAMRLELEPDSVFYLATDLLISESGERMEAETVGFGSYGRDGRDIWFDQHSDPGPGGARVNGSYVDGDLTVQAEGASLVFRRTDP